MPDIISEIGKFEVFGSKLGLERIENLLKRVGSPEKETKAFHVAGTNGKGSVSRYLYEILREAGYSTGLFTSPYIESFNERIQMDGECISDDDLTVYGRQVLSAAEDMVREGFESPTEFEVITAVALKYFAEKKADYVVLEVGLGGRGDSTNVIDNVVASIITSISLDHMDRLGDTIEKIAWEKAGIIRDNVPVFAYLDKDEAKRVVAGEAYRRGCAYYDFSDSKMLVLSMGLDGMVFSARIKDKDYENINVSMLGEHQCINAVTAIGSIEILRQKGIIKVEDDALSKGLKNALMPGRFEVCKSTRKQWEDKYFVLDGAHNEEAMEMSLKTLDDMFYGCRVLVLTGILADKDIDGILRFLTQMGDEYICTTVSNPRSLDGSSLAEKVEKAGKTAHTCATPEEALEYAMKRMEEYDVCICAGSFYLVGEIRSLLRNGNVFKVEK
jgi:dihydrofolate synthase/folylpolyglutamate synthase